MRVYEHVNLSTFDGSFPAAVTVKSQGLAMSLLFHLSLWLYTHGRMCYI